MNHIKTQHPSRLALDPLDLIFERLWGRPLSQETAARASASVELYEDDSHYHAQFDLPGAAKENITVKILENTIEVTAKRIGTAGETVLQRQLALPEEARESDITAKFENGVLSLAIAKPIQTQARTINID